MYDIFRHRDAQQNGMCKCTFILDVYEYTTDKFCYIKTITMTILYLCKYFLRLSLHIWWKQSVLSVASVFISELLRRKIYE